MGRIRCHVADRNAAYLGDKKLWVMDDGGEEGPIDSAIGPVQVERYRVHSTCLLYTSDAADE